MTTRQIVINTRDELLDLFQVTLLLPTHPALAIDELVSYTLIAFSRRDEFNIEKSAKRLLSYCRGADADVMDRFLKAWGKFCIALMRVFEHHQLWDENGEHQYYYYWHDDFDLVLRMHD